MDGFNMFKKGTNMFNNKVLNSNVYRLYLIILDGSGAWCWHFWMVPEVCAPASSLCWVVERGGWSTEALVRYNQNQRFSSG